MLKCKNPKSSRQPEQLLSKSNTRSGKRIKSKFKVKTTRISRFNGGSCIVESQAILNIRAGTRTGVQIRAQHRTTRTTKVTSMVNEGDVRLAWTRTRTSEDIRDVDEVPRNSLFSVINHSDRPPPNTSLHVGSI